MNISWSDMGNHTGKIYQTITWNNMNKKNPVTIINKKIVQESNTYMKWRDFWFKLPSSLHYMNWYRSWIISWVDFRIAWPSCPQRTWIQIKSGYSTKTTPIFSTTETHPNICASTHKHKYTHQYTPIYLHTRTYTHTNMLTLNIYIPTHAYR